MTSPLASAMVLPCSRDSSVGQLVHVAVEQVDEFHEHAGAALRVGGGPFRLRRLGALPRRRRVRRREASATRACTSPVPG